MEDLRNRFDVDAPRCRGGYLDEAPSCIWTDGDWVLEPKKDGNRVTLQIGAERSLLVGRNRKDFMKGVKCAGEFRDLSSTNPELAQIARPDLDGTVLDGEMTEMYLSDGSFDETTRIRIEQGFFVGYTAWTVLFVCGVDVRDRTEASRRELTAGIVEKLKHPKIRLIERVLATKENLQKFFAREEGAIAKKLTAGIPIGHRTNRHWWKLKGDENRTVDDFIIGVSESKSGGSGVKGLKRKANGKAATFTVAMMKGGEVIEVGKATNLPSDAKQFGVKDLERFRGRVIEMRVSGWDGKRFRWPRFAKWREDKSLADCKFEEQLGKGGEGE